MPACTSDKMREIMPERMSKKNKYIYMPNRKADRL